MLEGKIKQRQHLLDLTADGVAKDQVIRVPPGQNSGGLKILIAFKLTRVPTGRNLTLRLVVWWRKEDVTRVVGSATCEKHPQEDVSPLEECYFARHALDHTVSPSISVDQCSSLIHPHVFVLPARTSTCHSNVIAVKSWHAAHPAPSTLRHVSDDVKHRKCSRDRMAHHLACHFSTVRIWKMIATPLTVGGN